MAVNYMVAFISKNGENISYGYMSDHLEYINFYFPQDLIGNIYRVEIKDKRKNLQGSFVELPGGEAGFLKEKDRLSGQDISLVQIKGPGLNGKAPLLTENIRLYGKYFSLGLSSGQARFPLSIKKALKEDLLSLIAGEGGQVTVRERALDKNIEELEADFKSLINLRDGLLREKNFLPNPKLLYSAGFPYHNFLECLTGLEIEEVFINDYDLLSVLRKEGYGKDFYFKYQDCDLLEFLPGLGESLREISSNSYILKSGVQIKFENFETLNLVDVNSKGAFKGDSSMGSRLKANREVAKVLPFLLKTRNVGGQLVIDFLNMDDSGKHEIDRIIKGGMRETFKAGYYRVFGFSRMGLYEITISRKRRPLKEELEIFYRD